LPFPWEFEVVTFCYNFWKLHTEPFPDFSLSTFSAKPDHIENAIPPIISYADLTSIKAIEFDKISHVDLSSLATG
jgi:hypothetical protein